VKELAMVTTQIEARKTTLPDVKTYTGLRREVKNTLFKGRAALEALKVKVYWDTGDLLNAHLIDLGEDGQHGKRVIERLSNDLEIEATLLYRVLRFRRYFPTFATGQKLTWSHYRELLGVADPEKRTRLHEEALRKKWTVPALAHEVQKFKPKVRLVPKNRKGFLTEPPQGSGHVYRVRLHTDHLGGVWKALDLGFHVYTLIGSELLKGYSEGALVRWNDHQKQLEPETGKENFYFYDGKVEKVVDGDTLRLHVDLGFGCATRQYLRLRGINTPKVETAAGRQARDFVKKALGSHVTIQFSTKKRGPYDRYISDVWIGDTYLNNLLLQEHLAQRV
jgi:endonuclease YncB( thermonuclease family)